MATERAQRFVDALAKLEERGDVESLVSLFSEDAQVSNAASRRVFSSAQSAFSRQGGEFASARSAARSRHSARTSSSLGSPASKIRSDAPAASLEGSAVASEISMPASSRTTGLLL